MKSSWPKMSLSKVQQQRPHDLKAFIFHGGVLVTLTHFPFTCLIGPKTSCWHVLHILHSAYLYFIFLFFKIFVTILESF